MRTLFFFAICILSFSLMASDPAAKADSVIKTFAFDNNGPSMAVVIRKNDNVVFSSFSGYADVQKKIHACALTSYNIAGLSAPIVAMGIMILKDKKNLSYDEKIRDILPELPEYTSQITIKNLLHQNSGLPDMKENEILANTKILNEKAVLDYLHTFEELQFIPGKKIDKNPINNILLSLIIEKKYGKPFSVFVQKEICLQLGITGMVLATGKKNKIKTKATGYEMNGDSYIANTSTDKNTLYISSVYCSVQDYDKLMRAFTTTSLVSGATIAEALSLNYIPSFFKFAAFGWDIMFNKGKSYYFQTGTGMGFTHIALIIPDEQLSIVIFTNRSGVMGLRRLAFNLINCFSSYGYIPE